MKGLKPIAAALAIALALASVGVAAGEPHGRGGGGGGGWSHGGGPGWSHGPGGWAHGSGAPGWSRGPERYGGERRQPYEYEHGGRYAPPPFFEPRLPAPGGYPLRRGGRVPPEAWNSVVPDYNRHRLRPPPPGYSWVRMGDRYMLVSRRTGQIFDVIGR